MKLFELSAASTDRANQVARLYAREYSRRADELRAWDASGRSPESARFILCDEQTGELIGYGAVWHTGHRKFRMDLIVEPELRRQGFGERILEVLLQRAAALDAHTVQARADSAAVDALLFLEHRGFCETLRMHRFELDVPSLRDRVAQGEDHLVVPGLAIGTLAMSGRTPDVYAAIAEVYDAAGDEWPDADPGGHKPPLTGTAVYEMFERWQAIPDAVFLARSGDQYVGLTGIGASGKSVGTAVRPEYRRLGIATALKSRLIRWAAANGIAKLESRSAHPAMIHLNRKLGFEQTNVEVRLVRRMV
jgi:GNAT superfamily N-acetyltransferase